MLRLAALAALSFSVLVACSDDPASPDPAPEPETARAPSASALVSELDRWIATASGSTGAREAARVGVAGPTVPLLTTALSTVLFPGSLLSIPASASTSQGSQPVCEDIGRGYGRWARELSTNDVTDFDSTLAAGGSVLVHAFSEHSQAGDGVSAFAEVAQVTHQDASGARTVVGTTRNLEAPMVEAIETVELTVPVLSVSGWAAGDTLWLEQWGVVGAYEDPTECASGSNHITLWSRTGGAKITF